MIKAVFWDMDGTLALTEELHFASLREVSVRYGARVDDALQQEFIGLGAPDAYQQLVDRHGLDVDFNRWASERYRYFQDHEADVEPRPGAVAVWRDMQRRGIGQAVVSNSDRLYLNVNVRNLGLDEPRLISVARNDVREGKPAPDPYLRAAYLHGLKPAQCAVVEDSPAGAEAGLAAGMTTVIWPENPALEFPAGGVRVQAIAELTELLFS